MQLTAKPQASKQVSKLIRIASRSNKIESQELSLLRSFLRIYIICNASVEYSSQIYSS